MNLYKCLLVIYHLFLCALTLHTLCIFSIRSFVFVMLHCWNSLYFMIIDLIFIYLKISITLFSTLWYLWLYRILVSLWSNLCIFVEMPFGFYVSCRKYYWSTLGSMLWYSLLVRWFRSFFFIMTIHLCETCYSVFLNLKILVERNCMPYANSYCWDS